MKYDSIGRALFTSNELPKWKLTAWRPNARMWVLEDGFFQGFCSNTWVGHEEQFKDFLLECEFYFDGLGGGGICIRSDLTASQTWEHGYNLCIDSTAGRARGRLAFNVNPKGHRDRYLEFDTRKWQALKIVAEGPSITVTLDNGEAIHVVDDENRFPIGQICLEDRSCEKGDGGCDGTGHIKYRNFVVHPAR